LDKYFDVTLILDFLPKLIKYLPTTLYILTLSLIIGFVIGLLIALTKIYKVPILNQLSTIYISFFRGTPIIIQLFIVFYGIPAITMLMGIDTSNIPPLYAAIVTYALGSGASIAEIIRGAVNSVGKDQSDAAYSIALTKRQTFVRVIFPQAMYQALPNFGNTIIGFLKDTSLAFTIGVMDMSGRGETLISSSNHSLEVYVSLAIIYYLTAILLEKLFSKVSQLTRKGDSLTTVYDLKI